MKVAIVHDWLVGGGAEKVVLELHKLYPDAPIYTSYCTDEWRKKLDNKVVTGYLQRWPFSRFRKYLPLLRIWWFGHLDLSEFDLVISSSGNGEAKSVRTSDSTTHICYCHTPTHFYWRHYDYYLANPGFGPFASLGLKLLVKPLRKWDKKAAQRPNYYIANSTHIKNDIKKYYGRDSIVIHPPVETARFKPSSNNPDRSGFVTVGRQVPYKRVDLIVEACTKLSLPLTVIGNGPEHEKLVNAAGDTITFLTDASDGEVNHQLSTANAFILAAFEDFGITPVEALASGTPVIAYGAGGALDYVVAGKIGEFFSEQTVDALAKVLQDFQPSQYNPATIQSFAEQFSVDNFQRKIKDYVRSVTER